MKELFLSSSPLMLAAAFGAGCVTWVIARAHSILDFRRKWIEIRSAEIDLQSKIACQAAITQQSADQPTEGQRSLHSASSMVSSSTVKGASRVALVSEIIFLTMKDIMLIWLLGMALLSSHSTPSTTGDVWTAAFFVALLCWR